MADLPDEDQHDDRRSSGPALILASLCLILVVWAVAWLVDYVDATPRWWDSDGIAFPITTAIYGAGAILFLCFLLTPWRSGEPRPDDRPVCTNCFRPHYESVNFCPTCSRPLTWFAGTGPLEYVHAQAWCLGYAAHRPSRALHVIGMLVTCGLSCVGSVGLLAVMVVAPHTWHASHVGLVVGKFALLLVNSFIYFMLTSLCLRNWVRFLRDPDAMRPQYGTAPWWTFDSEGVLEEEDDGADPEGPDEVVGPDETVGPDAVG